MRVPTGGSVQASCGAIGIGLLHIRAFLALKHCSEFCREYLLVSACIRFHPTDRFGQFCMQIQANANCHNLSAHGAEQDVREDCAKSVNRNDPSCDFSALRNDKTIGSSGLSAP